MGILTPRLELIPASPEMLRAELQGRSELALVVNATVPESWPPELYDGDAVSWALARIEAGAEPDHAQWYFHYFVHRIERVTIGAGGFKGPPLHGSVEVGYSILPEYQRLGLASEATHALAQHAFSDARVARVIAHTLPGLTASIRVLETCGFGLAGDGDEPGTIRYELRRG